MFITSIVYFMAFRKNEGFGGGNRGNKKSFGSARFGGGRKPFGDHGGRGRDEKELFSAVCATCGKACEVPFRPSGDRPVYCRDCFGGKENTPRGDFDRRDDNVRNFERRGPSREFTPHAPQTQNNDKNIVELKRQIDAVHNKLDIVVKMIESLTPRKDESIETADEPVQRVKKASLSGKQASKKKTAKSE